MKKSGHRRFSVVPSMASGTRRASRGGSHGAGAALTAAETQRLWLAYVLIALLLGLLIVSILGVNFYAARGYVIKSLQNKVTALQEEKQKLDMRVAEAGSVLVMQQDLTAVGYIPAGSARYVVQTTQLSQR